MKFLDNFGKEFSFNNQLINANQSALVIAKKGIYFLQVIDQNTGIKTQSNCKLKENNFEESLCLYDNWGFLFIK